MNLLDRLKELEANRNIDCDAEERFRNALDDAWPELRAVVEAAKAVSADRGYLNWCQLGSSLAALDQP